MADADLFRAVATGEEHLAYWVDRLYERSPSFVYVLQGRPGTEIKVGTAKNIPARIAGLQTGNPAELRLLFVFPGDHKLEWELHKRLFHQRVRGEWFKPDTEFLVWVADLAARMVEAHDGESAYPPNWRDFGEWKGDRRLQSVSRLKAA